MSGFVRASLFLMMFFSSILQASESEMIKIECYCDEAVKKFRPLLDAWAISSYRDYPYLYVYQDETDYNTMFEVDPTAFVLFAERKGEKIGLLQANSLNSPYLQNDLYTPYAVLNQIREKGFDLEKILYVSCFLTTKEKRLDQEMATQLFHCAVEIAKNMGKTHICYMAIVQDSSHPLRPDPYIPVEPWSELDVTFKNIDVQLEMSWPTLQPNGQVKEESHTMAIFMTNI